MFVLTMARNVPLNNALASVDQASAAATELWAAYVRDWTWWNHLRTVASTAACGAFAADRSILNASAQIAVEAPLATKRQAARLRRALPMPEDIVPPIQLKWHVIAWATTAIAPLADQGWNCSESTTMVLYDWGTYL